MRITISDAPIAVAVELAKLHGAQAGAQAGAMASFVGYCRAGDAGEPVHALHLQHYPGFTEAEIARIAGEVSARHGLLDCLIIHRVGDIAPGEAIVLAAALSAHRAEAFAAVAQLMDYLKTDAPFWKREQRSSGGHWIEPTAQDRARRAAHD